MVSAGSRGARGPGQHAGQLDVAPLIAGGVPTSRFPDPLSRVTKARAPDGVKATLPLRHLEGWMFRPGMQLEVGWARGSLAVEGATETQSRPRSPQ